jgi:kynurenine formamidase
MSTVKYELGCYIPEHGMLRSLRRENLKSYIALTGWSLYWRRTVSTTRYQLGFISQQTAFFIATAVKTSNLTTWQLKHRIATLDGLRLVSVQQAERQTVFSGP